MASSYITIASLTTVLILLFLSPAPATAGLVTDADGEILFNHVAGYYIVPSTPNVLGSGALSWVHSNSSSNCPLFVRSKGNSVGTLTSIFWPPRVKWVVTSRFVAITFHDANAPCSEQLHWSVASGDDESNEEQLYVTAGPSVRSEQFDIRGFQIVEADAEKNEFYIKYCLSNRSSTSVSKCYDVGFFENGLLGVTPNKPVPFRFVKAFSDNLRMPIDRA